MTGNLEGMIYSLEATSNKINAEIQEVTHVTQSSSAMVEEVFASIEQQHEHIESMLARFKELEEMNEQLNLLVNEGQG